MQDLPGAPGTARQGRTRIIVSTNDGGVATHPRAPGHERPLTAQRAARHGRLSADSGAPGADVPLATTVGAPGQHRLRAVPPAPDHDRSRVRHQKAPGHGRPRAASSGAVRHDRPRATPRAPGADVPPATTAGAPGQYRLSAAQRAPDHFRSRPAPKAPGHGRPPAASSGAVRHDRPRATPRAPGADVPPATTAGAPGQHRLRAVAIATVALPAGPRRLRQEGLPHVPANPRTHTYPHSHRDTALTRTTYFRATPSPCTAGGPQGGQVMSPTSSLRRKPQSSPRPAARRSADAPSLPGKGPGVRSKPLLSQHTTHQVHPAVQVPPHPRSCSTAATGLFHQHPSRAPPRPSTVPLHHGATTGGPGPIHSVPTTPPLPMVERGPGGAALTRLTALRSAGSLAPP